MTGSDYNHDFSGRNTHENIYSPKRPPARLCYFYPRRAAIPGMKHASRATTTEDRVRLSRKSAETKNIKNAETGTTDIKTNPQPNPPHPRVRGRVDDPAEERREQQHTPNSCQSRQPTTQQAMPTNSNNTKETTNTDKTRGQTTRAVLHTRRRNHPFAASITPECIHVSPHPPHHQHHAPHKLQHFSPAASPQTRKIHTLFRGTRVTKQPPDSSLSPSPPSLDSQPFRLKSGRRRPEAGRSPRPTPGASRSTGTPSSGSPPRSAPSSSRSP